MQTDDSLPERSYYRLLKHLGQKETAPNQGYVVEWAVSSWTKKKPDATGWASWCAGAVCTSFLEAESEQIKVVGSLSVRTLFARLKKLGQVTLRSQMTQVNPKRGELVFFGKGESELHHVGLVDAYSGARSLLYTLEGNHNNSVSQNSRTEWYAFGRILY